MTAEQSDAGTKEELERLLVLSLAVGRSLDPHATSRAFLRVLMTWRELSGAFVWWLAPEGAPTAESRLVLFDGLPSARCEADPLPLTHPLWTLTRDGRVHVLTGESPDLPAVAGTDVRACALFPLGGSGVLQIDASSPTAIPAPAAARLQSVVAVLADALANGLAHERLQQSEAALRALIEAVPDTIQFKDRDGRWLVANSVCLRVFGLEDKTWEGLTDTAIGLRHPHLAAAMASCKASDDEAWNDGPLYRTEEAILDDRGRIKHYDVIKVPLFDVGGNRHAMVIIGRDITERRRSERNLGLAVEVTQVILWEVDFRNGQISYDRALLPILGLGADEDLGTLPAWMEHVHPEDRAAFAANMQLSLAPEGPLFDIEYRMLDDKQEVRWIHTRGRITQRDAAGLAVLAVGASMNITARKLAEAAIRSSEARATRLASLLRMMCDNVPDMIWAKDLDKRFLFANKAFCDNLLNAADTREPLGKTDMFFARRERDSHPDDPAWHTFGELCQDSDAITLGNGKPSVFEEFGNVKGRMLYLDVHKAPFRNENGEVIGTVGSARDVTGRRKIESELEQHRRSLEELVRQRTIALTETEARASHILQSSADGLYGVDLEGRITFVNPAMCAMLGYSEAQSIGRSAHALFHPRKADGMPYPAAECPGHAALLAGMPRRVDDEIYWHADGHSVPVMYAMHPVIQSGRHVGSVVSVVDMTKQRAAQQARELALVAAENLARVRREFLANMSHEIRTPLNGVLGFAQIGLRNYRDGDKSRHAFEKILTSGNLLLGVINDILDFSKIEAGKVSMEPTEVRLSEVIDEVIGLVRERARSKRIDLRTEWAFDLPPSCVADGLRLRQVLLNLLSNAVKFTASGSVTLGASREGGYLLFKIADTGIGMSERQLAQLFNPFMQADGSMTRRYGGTGLGLAISKRILELMGGSIRVASTPGAGSTFEVRLPYVPPGNPAGSRSGAAAADGRHAAGALAGLSILAAEDDPVNQALLAEILGEAGATVVVVENGREAVERVRRDGPTAFDIVLMDIQMPEMDGYEATRQIRALAPALPVVGQTAHALTEERQKCLAAGMSAFLVKPLEAAVLVRIVREQAITQPEQ